MQINLTHFLSPENLQMGLGSYSTVALADLCSALTCLGVASSKAESCIPKQSNEVIIVYF